MADENRIEELIGYLRTLGFGGASFENELREKIRENPLFFTVDYHKRFGKESMAYQLRFQRDGAHESPHLLKEIDATLHKPVEIEHKIISGIDTGSLDTEMAGVDWKRWSTPEGLIGDPETAARVGDIFDKLSQLANSDDTEGERARESLLSKHLPEEIYRFYSHWGDRKPRSTEHEQFSFSLDKWGEITADLAYLLMTERIDSLMNQLSDLGIEKVTGADMLPQVQRKLRDNPEATEIAGYYNTPEGQAEFSIPVRKIRGWYYVQPYRMKVTPYPPIEHDVCNGIDTAALEAMMREVDWKDEDHLFIHHKERLPDFQPDVYDIQEQLFRVAQDPVGARIADALRLKYLQGVPFFGQNIPESAFDLLRELPAHERKFPTVMELKVAANLLFGRAVLLPETGISQAKEEWVRLDLASKDNLGNYPMRIVKGYTELELNGLLVMLPVPADRIGRMRGSLVQGDLVALILNNGLHIQAEANPEQRTLNLYTLDRKPIPFNFTMDPDWRPAETTKQLTEEQETPRSKRRQKNRRRGL